MLVSTLSLSRLVKHAELVYAGTPEPTFDLLRSGRADAFASVGFVLQGFSSRLPGSRLLEGRYGANPLAMAVAKDRAGRLAYITEFVEDAKASGLAQRAIELIKGLTMEAEIGQFYHGVVKRVVEFGAFVEILPGTDGLIHISELAEERTRKVTDVVDEGDEVVVKVINIDRDGKIRLSRKEALAADPQDVHHLVG